MYTQAIDPENWDRIFVKFTSLGECRLLSRTPNKMQVMNFTG